MFPQRGSNLQIENHCSNTTLSRNCSVSHSPFHTDGKDSAVLLCGENKRDEVTNSSCFEERQETEAKASSSPRQGRLVVIKVLQMSCAPPHQGLLVTCRNPFCQAEASVMLEHRCQYIAFQNVLLGSCSDSSCAQSVFVVLERGMNVGRKSDCLVSATHRAPEQSSCGHLAGVPGLDLNIAVRFQWIHFLSDRGCWALDPVRYEKFSVGSQ